jgi:bifunctional ADP-heptose synthase (sugar kinase/adenylyltransferase)
VVGHQIVERAGGEVILVDLVPGQSTTRLVERAKPTGNKSTSKKPWGKPRKR